MHSQKEILSTINMIDHQHLDVRTITMGISLLDCADSDPKRACDRIYDKIMKKAGNLVKTGQDIEKEYGVPIINKRISVTPISLVAGASNAKSYVDYCKTLDKCARELGVNFLGGFSALVQKGITPADRILMESIPEALATTNFVCSSVNVGSTKSGINMDAVKIMGDVIKKTADLSKDCECNGCAKLVIFCNAPDDNPFMAGAFHGVGEKDAVINVGVSGPGGVKKALEDVRGKDFEALCEQVKRTAFKITRAGQMVAREASQMLDVPFAIADATLVKMQFALNKPILTPKSPKIKPPIIENDACKFCGV